MRTYDLHRPGALRLYNIFIPARVGRRPMGNSRNITGEVIKSFTFNLVDACGCPLGRLEAIPSSASGGIVVEAGEINLLDPLIFEDKVPHEWFTWLRHNAPIFRHRESGGPGFWVITRYDDVVEVGRDGVTYSSEQSRGGVVALEDMEGGADVSGVGR